MEVLGALGIFWERGALVEGGDEDGEIDRLQMHERIELGGAVCLPTIGAADEERDFWPILLDVNDFLDAGDELVVTREQFTREVLRPVMGNFLAKVCMVMRDLYATAAGISRVKSSRASAMEPVMAAAATMTGDINTVRPVGEPWRPLKFLLDEEAQS